MANNRMWLIHKPTLLGIGLGKRMYDGWYTSSGSNIGSNLEKLFDVVKEIDGLEHQDDYMLFMDDCEESSTCNETFDIDLSVSPKDGLEQFKEADPYRLMSESEWIRVGKANGWRK